MCDLCITRPPAASTAGALPVPNLAAGHDRARAAGLGTSSFQSTRDAPGRGAAEPASAAPAHPNITGCGRPPAPCTPENTWSYLCMSPASAQPHTALRTVMGKSCVSLRAWHCDPRAGSPHRASGWWLWFRLLWGKAKHSFLQREFYRSFTKHMHLCFGADTCSPKHPQRPLMWPPGAVHQWEPCQTFGCGGKAEGWQGWGAGGTMATKASWPWGAQDMQKCSRSTAMEMGWTLVLWSIKAEAVLITNTGFEHTVAAEGGRQQLPWEDSDNIHEQIIYTNHGAKQKYLCGTQLWLWGDKWCSSTVPGPPAWLWGSSAGSGVTVPSPRGWIYTFRSRGGAVGTVGQMPGHTPAKQTGRATLKNAKRGGKDKANIFQLSQALLGPHQSWFAGWLLPQASPHGLQAVAFSVSLPTDTSQPTHRDPLLAFAAISEMNSKQISPGLEEAPECIVCSNSSEPKWRGYRLFLTLPCTLKWPLLGRVKGCSC